jgi:TRAP-type C4-dicarboxylate transport system permease small subunit
MSQAASSPELPGVVSLEDQHAMLPPAWRALDRGVVKGTELALLAVGVMFTLMITLEVVSRYVFSFSIFFVHAAAKLLLVWFFLLGAGIALRRGAHVGFELIVSSLAPRRRRFALLAGQTLAVVFFLEMLWAGIHALGPAAGQTDSGLDISLVWAFLAIPVGFGLLLYHMLALMAIEWRRGATGERRP